MNKQTKINFGKFLYVLSSESFISISHVFFTTMWSYYYCLKLTCEEIQVGKSLHKLSHLISVWAEVHIHIFSDSKPQVLNHNTPMDSSLYLPFPPTNSLNVLFMSKNKNSCFFISSFCYHFSFSLLAPGILNVGLWFWFTYLMNVHAWDNRGICKHWNYWACECCPLHKQLTDMSYFVSEKMMLLWPKVVVGFFIIFLLVPTSIPSYAVEGK